VAIEFHGRKRRRRSVLLFWAVVRGGSAPAGGKSGRGAAQGASAAVGRGAQRSTAHLAGRRCFCSGGGAPAHVSGGWRWRTGEGARQC
jgi:hypothetical protein